MRVLFIMSVLAALLVPNLAYAKRKEPAAVEPVIYEGLRYVAPNDDGRRGYIQAWDTNTEKMMWEVTVYHNFINPILEEDVQWVFIKKLSFADGKMLVIDEKDRAYSVDLKTRTVKWKH